MNTTSILLLSDQEVKKLAILREYHTHGLYSRVGVVNLFIDNMRRNLETQENPSNQEFGLNPNQMTATLQVGAVSHIMMLIEDIAIFCLSFLNEDIDFYQYLDRKGNDDLGRIIDTFYKKIDFLSDDEFRKILSYINSEEYTFKNKNDKEFIISLMSKNIHVVKRFLIKSLVFRDSHIGIFRRYKHAGFPIFLGSEIPQNDNILYGKFDFVSFALTSTTTMGNEVTTLPFSKKALESYENFLVDIFIFLDVILNAKVQSIARKTVGVLPSHRDYFNRKLSHQEKIWIEKLGGEFEEKNPIPNNTWQTDFEPQAKYPAWYLHLDEHYSKRFFDDTPVT